MADNVSPLAPERFPDLPAIAGVTLATAHCGIRYKGRTDLMVAVLDAGHDRRRRLHPLSHPGRAGRLVPARAAARQGAGDRGQFRQSPMSSPDAQGRRVVEETAKTAAQLIGCSAREVYVSSTGVIGEALPARKDRRRRCPAALASASAAGWSNAARAIMTTDTFPKGVDATRDDRRRSPSRSTASPRARA